MARRKSNEVCKNAQDKANQTATIAIATHALGGIIDKGFPYDDAQRDEAFAPTMFPGFYHSQLTMVGKQDIHIDSQVVKKSDSKPIKQNQLKTKK
jgi:hypothetical protein